MTDEQLKKGKELSSLIDSTKTGLDVLRSIYDNKTREEPHIIYNDRHYWLQICGNDTRVAKLNRHYGNERLLEVMIAELQHQLESLEKEFAEL